MKDIFRVRRMWRPRGELKKRYDVVVIGGGAGGLSAARAAVRRGASALLVQEGRLGGDCTFTGCVPSKTLIEAAGACRPWRSCSTASLCPK